MKTKNSDYLKVLKQYNRLMFEIDRALNVFRMVEAAENIVEFYSLLYKFPKGGINYKRDKIDKEIIPPIKNLKSLLNH